MRRTTVARAVTVSGVGLHTGAPVSATLGPASSGTGITFVRGDLPDRPEVAGVLQSVSGLDRRTVLGAAPASVETVEHLLAATAALGIDDLHVELTGPEPPAVDGSAAPWCAALDDAGRAEGEGPAAAALVVTHSLEVIEGESAYRVEPADTLHLDVTIEWDHPAIGRQRRTTSVTPDTFRAEIAPARTFGFLHELEVLGARGLARGGNGGNAIVVGPEGPVTGALRWPDEFVRHKTLDLIGDLALLARPIRARITANRPGHRGNVALARMLLAHGDA